jgi:hypothetical protein
MGDRRGNAAEMNLPRNKAQRNTDQENRERLREVVLADPEAHGLRGSLSDGVNKKRMLELARDIEDREAKRFKEQGSRPKEEKRRARSPNAPEGDSMNSIGSQRKEARPLPDVLTTKWLYSARSVELQKLLQDNGRTNTEGLSITDLRSMARPLITTRTRKRPREPVSSKKASTVRPVKSKEKKLLPPVPPAPMDPQKEDHQPGLHVHCMACGFRMEISAEGIKALQKGGAG